MQLVAQCDTAGEVGTSHGAIVRRTHKRHPAQEATSSQDASRLVERDRVQPGIEIELTFEPWQRAVGRQERLLAEVGGELVVLHHSVQEPPQRALVALDDFVEGSERWPIRSM